MNKTVKTNLKDELIENVAEMLDIPEQLCETVVNWSYKNAKEATLAYTEIELSGFGKLMVSQNKLRKRISRFGNIKKGTQLKLTELGTNNWEKRMKGVEEVLEFLDKKKK